MMTATLITLHAGTILILLAAAVLAGTRRQRLGTRRSNILASGAVTLLLAEAMYPLRPLVLGRMQGDTLDSSLVLLALQAALHLAGLALIIGAVLTSPTAATTPTDKPQPTQARAQ